MGNDSVEPRGEGRHRLRVPCCNRSLQLSKDIITLLDLCFGEVSQGHLLDIDVEPLCGTCFVSGVGAKQVVPKQPFKRVQA